MTRYFLLAGAALLALIGAPVYNRVARRRGIIAKMNDRTLHEHVVPRGGGIVFGVSFSIAVIAAWLLGVIPAPLMFAIGVGGAAAVALGFYDDMHETRALTKLVLHILLAGWLLAVFWQPFYHAPLREMATPIRILAIGVLLFIPTWLINLYNFIDGADGLAITAGVFICASAIIVLSLTCGDPNTIFIFALLGASIVSFLYWNLPPAHVFMGDAGSIFLGFTVAALMLMTIATRQLSPWTWVAILAYYVGDTTTTTLCRMALVKRWYGVHRSHAYQNLARIHQSHGKITYGIITYQVLWALPLAIWSALQPHWAVVAAALALAPPVLWTLRFGPRLSSD